MSGDEAEEGDLSTGQNHLMPVGTSGSYAWYDQVTAEMRLFDDGEPRPVCPTVTADAAWRLHDERGEATRKLLEAMTPWMNRELDCDHSPSYWDMSLGYFIRLLVQRVQWSLLEFERLHEFEGSIDFRPSFAPRDAWEIPRDSRTSGLLLQSDRRAKSQLAALVWPPSDRISMAEPLPSREVAADTGYQKKPTKTDRAGRMALLGRTLAWTLQRHASGRILLFHSGWPPRHWLKISALAAPKAIPSLGFRIREPSVVPDLELRAKMLGNVAVSGLAEAALRALPSFLPALTLEGHGILHGAADDLLEKGAPSVIVCPPRDDLHLHWVATARERGTRVIFRQHGGAYGETVPPPTEDFERSVSWRFITWGWTGDRTLALPSGNLTRRREQYSALPGPRASSSSILWITQEAYWVSTTPPFEPFRDYQKRQEDLLRHLDHETQTRTVFRLRPSIASEDPHLGYEWLQRYPVSVDAGDKMIMQLVRDASVVLVDRAYSTSFLECLAVDKPVIIYSPGVVDYARADRSNVYRALVRAGIVVSQPETAAAVLKMSDIEIGAWWREESRYRTIADVRGQLALSEAGGAKRWAIALQSIPGV
jgi:putative transferase (TIGR04331 family)